jgi:hypothetical protein
MNCNEVAQDSIACSCQHPSKPSSMKSREFLDHLTGHRLLKKDCVSWH